MKLKRPLSDQSALNLVLGALGVGISTILYFTIAFHILMPIVFFGSIVLIGMTIVMHNIDSNHK